MRSLAILVALLVTVTGGTAAQLTGRASVLDGDTIEIRGERVRLHGIDAPESAQWCLNSIGHGYRCGQRASYALADKIGSQNIRCELLDRDQYDRHIGRCHLGDTDLNGWMVRQGHAVAYRRFSTEYVPAEEAARTDRAGLQCVPGSCSGRLETAQPVPVPCSRGTWVRCQSVRATRGRPCA